MLSTPPVSGALRDPTVSRRHGFTLVELLVVIAIISIIAGFLVPTIMAARERANTLKCQSNLREIARMAMIYADSSGKGFFPFGKGPEPAAHDSLNVMIRFFGNMRPDLFTCPKWTEGEIEVDADGKFELEASTCPFTWTRQRRSPSDDLPLASDKHIRRSPTQMNGHERGMNVVFPDSSVRFVLEEDLDQEPPTGLTH